MKKNELLMFGTVVVAGGLLPACKMPPKQAWSQIQSEGLIAYMGAAPMERQVAQQGRSSTSSETNSTHAWYDGRAANRESGKPTRRNVFGAPGTMKKGAPVPGHPGFVYSPHAPEKMVNVTKFKAGQVVRCPHSRRSFVVPEFGASNPKPTSTVARTSERSRQRLRFEPMQRSTIKKRMIEEQDAVALAPDADPEPQPEPVVADSNPLVRPDGMTATRVAGNANQVYSPYAKKNQIVDVTGMRPGDKARCPYTNRVFVVPGFGDSGKPKTGASAGEKQIAKISEDLKFRVLEGADKKEMDAAPAPKPKSQPNPTKTKPAADEVDDVELDPAPLPAPAPAPKVEKEKPAEKKPAPGKPAADTASPTASWSDKSGYAKSPYGGHLVDVRGKTAGSVVRCPFSGKLFKVPGGSN